MAARRRGELSLLGVVAFVFASACAPSSTDSSADRSESAVQSASTLTAPSTTVVDRPSAEDLEREAQREAGLAQVAAHGMFCPEHHDAMVDYFDRTGQIMDCQQFGDWVFAIAVALQEEARVEQQEELEAAVREELEEQARADREYVAAVKAELAALAAVEAREQRQRDFDEGVKQAIREQTAQATRQGEALVTRMCGARGGAYYSEIDPVRVELAYCNVASNWSSPSNSNGGGGGGGDLDCEDIGYEFEIDPNDDPHGLDGDGDGIACEGW